MARLLGRWLTILLARLVFGRPKGGPVGEVEKLLVIRTDERVGNVLLTIPLLRALRAGLPETEIVFLHARSKTALVQGLPYVDRLEPFEKKLAFRRPWALAARVLRLRREGFDVAIEAGHYHAFSLTAALLSRAVGARIVIGHDRGPASSFFDYPIPLRPGVVQDVSVKLGLLGPLGVEEAGTWLETPLADDPAAKARVAELLDARGLSAAPLLLVNPGARKLDRRWPPKSYAKAAALLAEAHGLTPLILWGPGEIDLAEEVVSLVGSRAQLAPPTDLAELTALFARAALVLTNDTGPMHLAVAAGAPTVAIFLAGDHERWGHALPNFEAVPMEPLREGGPSQQDLEAISEAASRLISRRAAV